MENLQCVEFQNQSIGRSLKWKGCRSETKTMIKNNEKNIISNPVTPQHPPYKQSLPHPPQQPFIPLSNHLTNISWGSLGKTIHNVTWQLGRGIDTL